MESALLEKLDKLDEQTRYPGVSCSKPQDNCWQNPMGARECPEDMVCTTVDSDKKIYRCKTPSIGYSFRCIMPWVIAIIILYIVYLVIFPFLPRKYRE